METLRFEDLGLSGNLLTEISKKGFEEPTEIQGKVIPLMLTTEVNILGQAQTGTGKTAAFGLPILEKLQEKTGKVQALVLTPTRELAIQVAEEMSSFKGSKKIKVMPIYGGQSMKDQIDALKKGVDIVVGTPGRVMDHIKRRTLKLAFVDYVVLDEADEMLNMGFIDEVEEILETTGPNKRILLFSATMPPHIKKIAQQHMGEFETIKTKTKKLTVDTVKQVFYEVYKDDKFEALCRLIEIEHEFYGLIFCRTKLAVDELTGKLIDRGYEAEGIHGDFSQHQRERSLDKFRKKRANILVATDVAARGIDIKDLTHVVNYSLPQDAESYVHRIGRTGRAGKNGAAVTLIVSSEFRKLEYIIKTTGTTIEKQPVPSIQDIIEAKKERLSGDVEKIMAQGADEQYSATAMILLGSNDPVDVVASLLQHSFGREFDPKNYKKIKKLSSEPKKKMDTTRLFVALGKKDGLTPKKLVNLINHKSSVKAGLIDDVMVKDSFSFLTVPTKEGDVILRAFKDEKNREELPLIHKANKMKDNNKKVKSRPRRR